MVLVVDANAAQPTDSNAPASQVEESTDSINEADAAEEDVVEEYEITDGSADVAEDDTGDTATSEADSEASHSASDTEAAAPTDGAEGTQGPDQPTGTHSPPQRSSHSLTHCLLPESSLSRSTSNFNMCVCKSSTSVYL